MFYQMLSLAVSETEVVGEQVSSGRVNISTVRDRLCLITPVSPLVSGGWRSAVKMRRVADCGGDPP